MAGRARQAALFYARKNRRAKWLAQLPTSDPLIDGRVWNNNGTVQASAGSP